jgi:hypothetical protein
MAPELRQLNESVDRVGRHLQADPGQVLDVLRDQEEARLKHQDPQALRRTKTVDLHRRSRRHTYATCSHEQEKRNNTQGKQRRRHLTPCDIHVFPSHGPLPSRALACR